ncbi:MAG: glutamine---fructose-6-phosphate transaminase (isomerizing) [Blastocatellia bacterium]|jgi:glucosamine--fructose-6-phosphate aminotransferase (isomerizing)|nr:glutamine---fructose-6-phosphate transaminase (isomerizing) [Blastocatellia bacterium]
MLQEIGEQPAALERTIREERVKVARLGAFLKRRDLDLIVLVARGSSDNAALFGRYLLEIKTGIPVSLSAPSVSTLYGAQLKLSRALVVGVSQSGEGEDINVVLEHARSSGAYTIGITNEAASTMTTVVDETLLMHGGRERSVAATKTFTGQMMLFYMLAAALSDAGADYEAIPELAARALDERAAIGRLVERYVFMENCVVVGRGLSYANAYELALKLMETCYVVAERFSSADFLHGPLAMVERHFPVIIFAPPGVMHEGIKELIERLNELRADTLVITSDTELASKCTRSIMLPGIADEFLAPIPYIIPGQLFAALLADAKGLDPDAPRSLSKVTRTL